MNAALQVDENRRFMNGAGLQPVYDPAELFGPLGTEDVLPICRSENGTSGPKDHEHDDFYAGDKSPAYPEDTSSSSAGEAVPLSKQFHQFVKLYSLERKYGKGQGRANTVNLRGRFCHRRSPPAQLPPTLTLLCDSIQP